MLLAVAKEQTPSERMYVNRVVNKIARVAYFFFAKFFETHRSFSLSCPSLKHTKHTKTVKLELSIYTTIHTLFHTHTRLHLLYFLFVFLLALIFFRLLIAHSRKIITKNLRNIEHKSGHRFMATNLSLEKKKNKI